MKNERRPPSIPHRLGVATVWFALGVFVAPSPVAEAWQAGGSPPPLVVFAAQDVGSGRGSAASAAALSAEGAATLEAIRSDPAASGIRIGYSAPTAVLEAQALSLALPPAPGAQGGQRRASPSPESGSNPARTAMQASTRGTMERGRRSPWSSTVRTCWGMSGGAASSGG